MLPPLTEHGVLMSDILGLQTLYVNKKFGVGVQSRK